MYYVKTQYRLFFIFIFTLFILLPFTLGAPDPAKDDDKESDASKISKVEFTSWPTVNRLFPVGSKAEIIDCKSGKRFKIIRVGGSRHADCRPETKADSDAHLSAWGYSSSDFKKPFKGWCRDGKGKLWRPKPGALVVKGKAIAVGYRGCPHSYTGLGKNYRDGRKYSSNSEGNGFPGHFCVHPSGGTEHAGGKTVNGAALKYIKSKGCNLDGKSVPGGDYKPPPDSPGNDDNNTLPERTAPSSETPSDQSSYQPTDQSSYQPTDQSNYQPSDQSSGGGSPSGGGGSPSGGGGSPSGGGRSPSGGRGSGRETVPPRINSVPDQINPTRSDIDGDGIPNVIDPDIDGDGIKNPLDLDMDGNGIPDKYEDVDGDGIPNGIDPDIDGDDIPNHKDPDTKTSPPHKIDPLNQTVLDCPDISLDNIGQFTEHYKKQVKTFETYYSHFIAHLKKVRIELEKQQNKCNMYKELINSADYTHCSSGLSKIAELAKKTSPALLLEEFKQEIVIVLDTGSITSNGIAPINGSYDTSISQHIVERIKDNLTKMDYTVYVTYKDGQSSSIDKRIQFAQSKNPHIFVSVQAHPDGEGVRAVVADSSGSHTLGDTIIDKLVQQAGYSNDKILYYDKSSLDVPGFSNLNSPGAIIFFGNPKGEENLFGLSRFIQQLASSIARGIDFSTPEYVHKPDPNLPGDALYQDTQKVFNNLLTELYPSKKANPDIRLPQAKTDELEEHLAQGVTPSVCDESAQQICLSLKEKSCRQDKIDTNSLCSLCTVLECNKGIECQDGREHFCEDCIAGSKTMKPYKSCFAGEDEEQSQECAASEKKDSEINVFQCNERLCNIYTEKGQHVEVVPPLVEECQQNIADLIDNCVVDNENNKHGVTYYLDRVVYTINTYETIIEPRIKEARKDIDKITYGFSTSASNGFNHYTLQEKLDLLQKHVNFFKEKFVGEFQLVCSELILLFKDSSFQADIKKRGNGDTYQVKSYEVGISKNTKKGRFIENNILYRSYWKVNCPLINTVEAVKTWYNAHSDVKASFSSEIENKAELLRQTIEFSPDKFKTYMDQEHKAKINSRDYVKDRIIHQMAAGCGLSAGKCAINKIDNKNIKELNLDRWSDEGYNYVLDLARQSPHFFFVSDCTLNYNTGNAYTRGKSETFYEPVNAKSGYSETCAKSCQTCVGTRESHCHAHRGVCVCEESSDLWNSIDIPCSETANIDEKPFLQCCLQLFGLNSVPEDIARPQKNVNMCEYSPAKNFGISIDYCRSKTSDTGYCCHYAFDEMPINSGCLVDHKSYVDDDDDGKTDEDPVDGKDNDNDGRIDEDALSFTGEVYSKDRTELVSVSFTLLRNNFPASVFFAGDTDVKIIANIKNNDFSGFAGNVELYLDTYKSCLSSECLDDGACLTDCEVKSDFISYTDIPYLAYQETKRIETDDLYILAQHGNSTMQIRAVITDSKGNTVEWKSGLFYIIPMTSITVLDGFFVNEASDATLSAFSFENIRGVVTVSIDYYPVDVQVYALKNDQLVQESLKSYSFTESAKKTKVYTNEIALSSSDVGSVFRLGIAITNKNGDLLLDQILSEQPLPLDICSGTIIINWCEKEKSRFKVSYPAAFLSVKNPQLTVDSFKLTDNVGTSFDLDTLEDDVSATVEVNLKNEEKHTFQGDVSVKIYYDESLASEINNKDQSLILNPDQSAFVSSNPVLFTKASFPHIHVRAKDRQNITWLDNVLDSMIYSNVPASDRFLEISTDIKDRLHISTHIEFGLCKMLATCNNCLRSCVITVNEDICEITPISCDCLCEIEDTQSLIDNKHLNQLYP